MSDSNNSFASPSPAGLMVIAFYLASFWPVATGMAPQSLQVVLVPLGLAGATVQMVAGVIELRNGQILPGNVMLAFSTFMWLGMGESLLKALEIMPAQSAAVDGWVFFTMGIFMTCFTPGFFNTNLATVIFMIFTDIFFLSAGLSWLLGSEILWLIAGWDLPLCIISIIWVVCGTVLNTHLGRQVIPLGPPLMKSA